MNRAWKSKPEIFYTLLKQKPKKKKSKNKFYKMYSRYSIHKMVILKNGKNKKLY